MPTAPLVSSTSGESRGIAVPEFACTWTQGGSAAAWVHVAGELDVATAPQLATALREAQAQALLVVLDARELTFLDSSGVHAILDATRDAQLHDGLLLVATSPLVDRLLALTGATADVSTFELASSQPAHPLHGPGTSPLMNADSARRDADDAARQ